MSLERLCETAKLYLVLSLIFLVFGIFTKMRALTLIIKAIFVVVWTLVLNWMCKKGFKFISWFLVLLPFVALLLSVVTHMDMIALSGGGKK